jgi:hypothetical protein
VEHELLQAIWVARSQGAATLEAEALARVNELLPDRAPALNLKKFGLPQQQY